jgi:predicted transcriptional regulator
MLAYVKRTTIKLPDDLDREMRDEAARRGLTVSDWTREAIAAHLPRQGGHRQLLAAGAGKSGRSDISERIEEILGAELPDRR